MNLFKKIISKPRREWIILGKRWYKDVIYAFSRAADKSVVSIIGCQRSGSTMLYEIFSQDKRAKVYGEFCNLNSDDKVHKIRLNAIEKVQPILKKLGFPLVVLKPLVESQNVSDLLNLHDNAYCIWLFRDFRDVAASNIKKWGPDNGKNNLRAIINSEEKNWRFENVPLEIESVVRFHYHENMSKYDAAALFWWVRNSHYFRQNLQTNPRVYTCNYADLVRNPESKMRSIYQFVDVDYPKKNITAHVHNRSIKKGDEIPLSQEIDTLCQELYQKLLRNVS